MNLIQRLLSGSASPKKEAQPRPVIVRREEELPPELRYRMRPDRIYRKFPFDSAEPITEACGHCGAQKLGETQEKCVSCGQDILPRMVDVTEEPNHLLRPEDPQLPQIVGAEALIPTFGGGTVKLGQKARLVRATGDIVEASWDSQIDKIAGNKIGLGGTCSVIYAVARDELVAYTGFVCDQAGGIASKSIRLGTGSRVDGDTIVPEGGSLIAGEKSTFDKVYVGGGTHIQLEDGCKISELIILGPGVVIQLGKGCSIFGIESNHNFQLTAGNEYRNDDHCELQGDYDILQQINELVDLALEL